MSCDFWIYIIMNTSDNQFSSALFAIFYRQPGIYCTPAFKTSLQFFPEYVHVYKLNKNIIDSVIYGIYINC